MAFFRKKQQGTEEAAERLAKAIDADSQAKWDELERLVSGNAEASNKAPESTSTQDTYSPSTLADTTTPEFGGYDLRQADASEFASELKVNLPDDSQYVDVTPEPEPVEEIEPEMTASEPYIPSSYVSDHTASDIPAAETLAAASVAAVTTQASLTQRASVTEPTDSAYPIKDDGYVTPPPAVSRPDRADIGAMRLDVARISADIQSGEELYRRAQQRIENLTGFVARAEIDFSMLNRMEPENRRLKARNRTLEREIDTTTQKIEVLRADIKDREHHLTEKSRLYEVTVGKLAVAQKSLQEYERALNTSRESADRNALNAERLQTSLDVERRENEVLRERMTDVVTEVDVKQSAYIEAKKVADSLAQDCSDFRHAADTAEKDADQLRKALATAQTQNNAMKAEMMGMHEDIRTFKTQSEFTIISREDELTSLQQQVDHLTKQLDIKDDIVRSAARDVLELRKIRTGQDLERERLEAHIQTQAFQLEQANSDLLKTKQDVTDFDRRYRDVATALSVSQARRMSNEPSATPDIQPHTENELTDMSASEAEERIMDFRLGLRNDIT